jgi:hypothetical protein
VLVFISSNLYYILSQKTGEKLLHSLLSGKGEYRGILKMYFFMIHKISLSLPKMD